jgi:hypothetical protein
MVRSTMSAGSNRALVCRVGSIASGTASKRGMVPKKLRQHVSSSHGFARLEASMPMLFFVIASSASN